MGSRFVGCGSSVVKILTYIFTETKFCGGVLGAIENRDRGWKSRRNANHRVRSLKLATLAPIFFFPQHPSMFVFLFLRRLSVPQIELPQACK